MNQTVLAGGEVVYYAVKVNGKIVASNFLTHRAAESVVENFSEDRRMLAEIVPMTADGKEILLG